MLKIKNFIAQNWLAFSFGMLILTGFLYFSYSGNRFCDCTSTERYKEGTHSRTYVGHSSSRYYHK